MNISERLRNVILEIRRKPYPISDLIPMLSSAANELDSLALVAKYESDLCNQALQSRKRMEDFLKSIYVDCGPIAQKKIDAFTNMEINK